jgi:hypothetical protein
MSGQQIYLLVSVLVLAGLLFFPVARIIWTLSVRRLQRKLGRELDQDEIVAQLKRARFLAFFLALIFSYLFNGALLGTLYG